MSPRGDPRLPTADQIQSFGLVNWAQRLILQLYERFRHIDDDVAGLDVTTTRGDLIRRGASAPERVALGTVDQALTSDGTDAVWANVPKFKIGSFDRDLTTATGTQDVTGLGFTPRFVLLFGGVNASSKISLGLSDATSHECLFDNNASTPATWGVTTSVCITCLQSGVDYQQATVSAMASGQFTVSWTKTGSPTGTATIIYAAFA